MRAKILAIQLGVVIALAHAVAARADERLISFDPDQTSTSEELQEMLDRFVADHPLNPGASVYVDAPRLGLPFNGAAGRFAHGSARPLDPDDPYRNASITKTWTAATVLRLVEDGRMSLSDTIDQYLPAELVGRVHVMDDGISRGHQITIRQMLNHTSGIYNYSVDERWLAEVGAQPRKEWTAEELVQWAIRNGKPKFKPGEGWDYNDTAYALLTIILKRLTGKPHPAVYRDTLPMDELPDTYLEKLEQPPAGARAKAHQYFLAVDMNNYDPSFDTWGGGGLVTTGRDQAHFIRALFEGRVYKRRSTLRAMLKTVAGSITLPGTEPEPLEYGLGIERAVHDGTECWYHTGAWGGSMYFCPALDLAFAGTTNQFWEEIENSRALATRIVEIVKAAPRERIKLAVRPTRTRQSRTTTFHVRATAAGRAIPRARVRLANRRTRTDTAGRARLTLQLTRAGRYHLVACKPGLLCDRATVRVTAVRDR